MERWPSGLRRTPGKCVGVKASRGFESLSLRQMKILIKVKFIFELDDGMYRNLGFVFCKDYR